jgi:hypothetical protein
MSVTKHVNTMKLNDRGPTPASSVQAQQDVRKLSNTNTGGSVTRDADASRDGVEFSGDLGRLARGLSTYGNSRASHVQALAAQYQSGKYRPDSVATSQGMVREALVSGPEKDRTLSCQTPDADLDPL